MKEKNEHGDTTSITITWSNEDVYAVASNLEIVLTDVQVGAILDSLFKYHDAQYGVNWGTIEDLIIGGDYDCDGKRRKKNTKGD